MTAANPSAAAPAAPKKWTLWTGRVLSALPVLMFLMSASLKFTRSPDVMKEFVERLGYPESMVTGIGLVEVVSTILYAIPHTAVLGAILLTAYLGGAVTTHLRVGDPFILPIVLGIVVWAGLYLRDERLRALLPLRTGLGK